MVHALTEAHRVLEDGGTLADLRPARDPGNHPHKRMLLELWRGRLPMLAGTMSESPEYHGDYVAADRAVEHVLRDNSFLLHSSETFWLRTYFKDLATLDDYLATEWPGTTLPQQTREVIAELARQYPRGRIAAAELVRLNILKKPVWTRLR